MKNRKEIGGISGETYGGPLALELPKYSSKGMFIFVTEASSYSYKYLSMFAN